MWQYILLQKIQHQIGINHFFERKEQFFALFFLNSITTGLGMLILPRGTPVISSSSEPFRSFGATQRRRRARSRKRPLIHIDRALVHASLSATLFSLSCCRRHRSVIEAWTKRWRLHNPPPAKADTDRKHTSSPTATCIPHNVFAATTVWHGK